MVMDPIQMNGICNWRIREGLTSLITDGQMISSRIKLPVNEAEVFAHSCTDGLQTFILHVMTQIFKKKKKVSEYNVISRNPFLAPGD